MTDTLPTDELEPTPKPGDEGDPEINPLPGEGLDIEPRAAMKTWAPYDRLLAGDLNTAFSYANHSDIALPGALNWAGIAGVTIPATGSPLELKHGAPDQDPLGIWQANGRLTIPAGCTGIWMYNATFHANAPSGATPGVPVQVYATIGAYAASSIASIARWYSGGQAPGSSGGFIKYLSAGQTLTVQAYAITVDGVSAKINDWAMIMLARRFGAFGS